MFIHILNHTFTRCTFWYCFNLQLSSHLTEVKPLAQTLLMLLRCPTWYTSKHKVTGFDDSPLRANIKYNTPITRRWMWPRPVKVSTVGRHCCCRLQPEKAEVDNSVKLLCRDWKPQPAGQLMWQHHINQWDKRLTHICAYQFMCTALHGHASWLSFCHWKFRLMF